jgi:hypothetical protein
MAEGERVLRRGWKALNICHSAIVVQAAELVSWLHARVTSRCRAVVSLGELPPQVGLDALATWGVGE